MNPMRKGLLDRLEAVTRLDTLQKAKDDLALALSHRTGFPGSSRSNAAHLG